MKKMIAILCTIAVITGIAGCRNVTVVTNPDSDNVTSEATSVPEETTVTTEATTTAPETTTTTPAPTTTTTAAPETTPEATKKPEATKDETKKPEATKDETKKPDATKDETSKPDSDGSMLAVTAETFSISADGNEWIDSTGENALYEAYFTHKDKSNPLLIGVQTQFLGTSTMEIFPIDQFGQSVAEKTGYDILSQGKTTFQGKDAYHYTATNDSIILEQIMFYQGDDVIVFNIAYNEGNANRPLVDAVLNTYKAIS